ncbi:MAG: cytochrome P450 [Chloroflexota bacterium]
MSAEARGPQSPVSLLDLKDIDPFGAYEEIRAVGPVSWDAGMRAWLVVTHAGCTEVLRREDLYAEPTGDLADAARIVGRRDIRSLVGDDHATLHRAVSHAWRPDPIAALASDAIRPLLAERIAAVAESGDLELYGELARLLPIAVISRVLGLPDADAATLDRAKTWMEAVLAWRHSYGEDADARAAALVATRALEPLLRDPVRAQAGGSADGFLGLLWEAGAAIAADWGEQDVIDNAKFMYEGGSETTAFFLTTAVHRFLALPAEARAATLVDDTRLDAFLEEVLRHSPVIHIRARRATGDHVLAGVRVGAGDRVIAVTAAANRDPLRWERPATFDPGRAHLRGHLAFSVGPRHCAGAHIARMEVREGIRGLFRAFPDLRRAPDAPEPQPLGFVSRSWRPLALVHAPVPAAEAAARVRGGDVAAAAGAPAGALYARPDARGPRVTGEADARGT